MWFYRNGTEVSEKNLPKVQTHKRPDCGWIDRTGPCGRCGGAGGSRSWYPDGGICYRCRGRNSHAFESYTDKVYTAEKLAKLVAIADKKEAKRVAAQEAKDAARFLEFVQWGREHKDLLGAIQEAEGNTFLADLARKLSDNTILSDRQLDAAAAAILRDSERKAADAASDWVGEVKERLDLEVEVLFIKEHFGSFGPIDIIKMRDSDGNMLTWFASGITAMKRGDRCKIKGTVKKHDDYRGVKQTVLTRCKVLETYTTVTPDEAANMEQVA